ncbi:MAG: hypothetical protein GX574_10490 [Lentisphaerae bacterium]|nr:hypothetical protein [Lentisphaerota bacterium]
MRERHGIPAIADFTTTARHEAGHLLMLWLLDRQGVASGIADGCGLTKALDEPGAMETPHQRILYAMAGMVLGGDSDLLRDLRQHAMEPGYFDPMSDSHYVAEALPYIGGEPALVLRQFHDIILRLGSRFNKAHRQATKLLMEKRTIAFDAIHGLFSQWDVEYGLVSRPKSDIVCRMIARTFRWRLPRGRFIGWDFKPLPEGYEAPTRMGLMELVEMVKGQVAGEKSRDKIAIQT